MSTTLLLSIDSTSASSPTCAATCSAVQSLVEVAPGTPSLPTVGEVPLFFRTGRDEEVLHRAEAVKSITLEVSGLDFATLKPSKYSVFACHMRDEVNTLFEVQ